MKICPRCNREYDDALENCLVCGASLTTYTPILTQEERATLSMDEEVTGDMLEEINPENLPEVICSVMGKEEAVRLSELLREHHIPCMCKENGEEDVYDLLIPKKNFNKALELLHEDEADLEQQEEGTLLPEEWEDPVVDGESQSKPSVFQRFIKWLFQ